MTIIIPMKVYKTIIAASVRFANAKIPKTDWLEANGIFVGRIEGSGDNARIIITETYPIMHQKKDKDAVIDQYIWADEDYLSMSIIDDEAVCRDPPEFIVGWWHSHPSIKMMLTQIDIRTTYSYQHSNPLAFALVFDPERLVRQIEPADKRGDPDIKLKNDLGFKIFRLDDPSQMIQATYHEVDFKIEGFESIESLEQLIIQMQKFIVDVTMNFPKDQIVETYDSMIFNKINELNSQIQGTDEYLRTLIRKGEQSRVQEVLEKQKKDIKKYVAETFIKIENLKEFKDYLEYKERESLIPKIDVIISRWDEAISKLDTTLDELSKKF